jgi:hypothetical protein
MAVLLLTLVTSTRRLSLARGCTATNANALLVGAPVVGEVGENRCAAGLCLCRLHREGGKQAKEGWT